MGVSCMLLRRTCICYKIPRHMQSCVPDQRFTSLGGGSVHAEAPRGHARPLRLSDKMHPSQPSSVGTEATCPVVVAHTLARWRMPMVRPDCPYTWVVPLVGLGSTLGGAEGAG